MKNWKPSWGFQSRDWKWYTGSDAKKKPNPNQQPEPPQTKKSPGLRMQPIRIIYMQAKGEMELSYDTMSYHFGLHAAFIYMLLLVMTNTL